MIVVKIILLVFSVMVGKLGCFVLKWLIMLVVKCCVLVVDVLFL